MFKTHNDSIAKLMRIINKRTRNECLSKIETIQTTYVIFPPNFSLTKDYRNRPKYPELLESAFIKKYENADVDVATWFASVMHNQQPNNTEPRR